MTTSEHPPLEDLLLWRTGELTLAEAEAIESHLQQCSVCQDVVDDIRSIVDRVVKVDAEAELRRQYATSQRQWDRTAKVFKSRSFMGTTASALIGALLLVTFTQWTPEARAESLLNKAVETQTKESRPPRFLKIASGSLSCEVGFEADNAHPQLVSIGANSFCENVSRHLAAAGRPWDSLLSAASFQQWRHSLAKKKDSVHKSADTIEISTSTDQGPLHEAILRLQSSDYHSVGAHFEFAGAEPLSIDINEEYVPLNIASRPSVPSPQTPQGVIDPLDETEAQLRLALHRAHLDRNILLAVDRSGAEIRVWGVVPSDADKATVETEVQTLSPVRASIRTEAEQRQEEQPLPWTAYQGSGAPLAYDQLTALYPDDSPARQDFQNDLDTLTRTLTGEAKSRDAMLALRSRLAMTSYDQQLATASEDLAIAMRRDTLALSSRLAPLTGPIAHAGEPLTYQQAVQIYTLVHELAVAGGQYESIQLSQAVRQTRRLLSRR